MQFIKNFFCHDKTIIGLSGLRKQKNLSNFTITEKYKKTFIQNTEKNYMLL